MHPASAAARACVKGWRSSTPTSICSATRSGGRQRCSSVSSSACSRTRCEVWQSASNFQIPTRKLDSLGIGSWALGVGDLPGGADREQMFVAADIDGVVGEGERGPDRFADRVALQDFVLRAGAEHERVAVLTGLKNPVAEGHE